MQNQYQDQNPMTEAINILLSSEVQEKLIQIFLHLEQIPEQNLLNVFGYIEQEQKLSVSRKLKHYFNPKLLINRWFNNR